MWVWSIIDVARHDFRSYNKIIWLLLLIFIPPLGLLLYMLIGLKQRTI
jgi:hypothetical protein